MEPLHGALLVSRGEAEPTAVGREMHPSQAPVELLLEKPLGLGRGGRKVGQEAVHQVVDVRVMSAPYSVLPCRHLLGGDLRAIGPPGAVAARREDRRGMTDFVTLRDGRELAYEQYGDPAGFPVLSCHGGLSSRLDAAPAHGAALAKGARTHFARSPGHGLLDLPAGDAACWTGPRTYVELTESLGIDRFAVMGWSAGGPYAAVCAAKLRDRVTAAALLSSSVPLDAVWNDPRV